MEILLKREENMRFSVNQQHVSFEGAFNLEAGCVFCYTLHMF